MVAFRNRKETAVFGPRLYSVWEMPKENPSPDFSIGKKMPVWLHRKCPNKKRNRKDFLKDVVHIY